MAAILASTDQQSTTEDDQSLPIIDIERFSSLKVNRHDDMGFEIRHETKQESL